MVSPGFTSDMGMLEARNTVLDGWGRFVYWTTVWCTRMAGCLLFRLRIEGLENIPPSGSLLIVSNHLSHLDAPLVAVAFRRPVFYLANRKLFRVPVLRSVLKAVKTIVVDRGRARESIETALSYLRLGQPVGIFPEGTRSNNGRVGRAQGGVVSLSLQTGCQILPVAIIGTDQALSKGSHRLRPRPVRLRIGEPFTLPFSGDSVQPTRELIHAASRTVMEQIEALLPAHMRSTQQEKASWYGSQR